MHAYNTTHHDHPPRHGLALIRFTFSAGKVKMQPRLTEPIAATSLCLFGFLLTSVLFPHYFKIQRNGANRTGSIWKMTFTSLWWTRLLLDLISTGTPLVFMWHYVAHGDQRAAVAGSWALLFGTFWEPPLTPARIGNPRKHTIPKVRSGPVLFSSVTSTLQPGLLGSATITQ